MVGEAGCSIDKRFQCLYYGGTHAAALLLARSEWLHDLPACAQSKGIEQCSYIVEAMSLVVFKVDRHS
jgi:hypothetical protein